MDKEENEEEKEDRVEKLEKEATEEKDENEEKATEEKEAKEEKELKGGGIQRGRAEIKVPSAKTKRWSRQMETKRLRLIVCHDNVPLSGPENVTPSAETENTAIAVPF